jgi:hypothetical protein
MAVVEGGENWAIAAIEEQARHCDGFLDIARGIIPAFALRLGDRMSRRWLVKSAHPYLDEIDRLAARAGREGIYTFNLAYEWACLGAVGAAGDGDHARFLRVLDYRLRGVGRHLVAVKAQSPAGPWLNITWPGYAGVIQGVAPGRFAACLNQPPSASSTGLRPLDWFINHLRIWRQRALPPEYLLRRVFETAGDYWQARHILATTPIARPVIFVLAGVAPDEGCVIERKEGEARIHEGPAGAGNHWLTEDWGRARKGKRRSQALGDAAFASSAEDPFHWLRPPHSNWKTRLAMVADPATGLVIAQGCEGRKPATGILRLNLAVPVPVDEAPDIRDVPDAPEHRVPESEVTRGTELEAALARRRAVARAASMAG